MIAEDAPDIAYGAIEVHGDAPNGEAPRRALFSSMVSEPADSKSACRIANSIESGLIQQHWSADIVFGSEASLIDQFQVGKSIVREAVRILDARGTARMRRGPNGGLKVLSPTRERAADLAADYIRYLGVDAEQVAAAELFLQNLKTAVHRRLERGTLLSLFPDLESVCQVALPLFDEVINSTKRNPQQGRDPLGAAACRSRADQIARRLLANYSSEQWKSGIRLGTTVDLCERYHADISVLRQAIRILESSGLAVALCGRGQGLVTCDPGPGAVCRSISCHFAAQGLSARSAMALFHWASMEAAGEMAHLANREKVARVHTALEMMARAAPHEAIDAAFAVEEAQFAILANPLITLFVRSTQAFSTWYVASPPPRHGPSVDALYIAETRKVLAAIAKADGEAASAAQDRKYQRMAKALRHPWSGEDGPALAPDEPSWRHRIAS